MPFVVNGAIRPSVGTSTWHSAGRRVAAERKRDARAKKAPDDKSSGARDFMGVALTRPRMDGYFSPPGTPPPNASPAALPLSWLFRYDSTVAPLIALLLPLMLLLPTRT